MVFFEFQFKNKIIIRKLIVKRNTNQRCRNYNDKVDKGGVTDLDKIRNEYEEEV